MILHGLFLCITSFISGVILTWLLFCLKMDRKKSAYFEPYLRMMENRDDLANKLYRLKQENESLKEINSSFLARHKHERELSEKIINIFYDEEKESGNSKD